MKRGQSLFSILIKIVWPRNPLTRRVSETPGFHALCSLRTSWSVSVRGILLPVLSDYSWAGHVTQFWPMRWISAGGLWKGFSPWQKKRELPQGKNTHQKPTTFAPFSISLCWMRMRYWCDGSRDYEVRYQWSAEKGEREDEEPMSWMTLLNGEVKLEIQGFCFLRQLKSLSKPNRGIFVYKCILHHISPYRDTRDRQILEGTGLEM